MRSGMSTTPPTGRCAEHRRELRDPPRAEKIGRRPRLECLGRQWVARGGHDRTPPTMRSHAIMTQNLADKVYYFTTDLANAEEARRLALRAGIHLEILFPKDLPLPADARAVVIDLDYLCLDARGRRQFLQGLPAQFP